MPGLTSSNTESENLITDISQEISRLALNLDEEALPETERTRLRAFFTSILNNAKIKVVSNVLNTIPKDNCTERLAYLKKVSTGIFIYISIFNNIVLALFVRFLCHVSR